MAARAEQAAASHREAQAEYTRASRAYAASSKEFRQAAEAAEKAERVWAYYQALVEVAALVDAGKLDAYRRWRRAPVEGASFSCDRVSREAFRRELTRMGQELEGVHVHHIVPESLGGADHPGNYTLLDASTNESLGNLWDPAICAELFGARDCAQAVAVSKACGSFKGPM